MSERYDLNIDISYSLRAGYKSLLKDAEWVRGLPVRLTIKVANKSATAFPGAKVSTTISEHGQSMGTGSLDWTSDVPLSVPNLEPGKSAKLSRIGFVPLLEGLCEVKLAVEEAPDTEVWIAGRKQDARRRTITAFFSVARWQEMEIIMLLRKLIKEDSNVSSKGTL